MGAGLCTAAAHASVDVEHTPSVRRPESDSVKSESARTVVGFDTVEQLCGRAQQSPSTEFQITGTEATLSGMNKILTWKKTVTKAAADTWSKGRLQASIQNIFRTATDCYEISEDQLRCLQNDFESIASPMACMNFNRLRKLQVLHYCAFQHHLKFPDS
jgi:hypothetical protein